MHRNLEIAINTHGKAVVAEDARGKHRLFIPIIVYRNQVAIRGGFIPWKALCGADDGSTVVDKFYTHKRKKETFICNQTHSSNNERTFKQALTEVMQKEQ